MKKLLLLLFAFSIQQISAQYTLTLGSMYVPGDIIEDMFPCTNTLVPPGSSGSSQTWNYLNLNPNWATATSATCIGMSSVPHATLFPTGSIGISSSVGSALVYENTATASRYMGYAQPSASNSIAFFDPRTVFTFPFSYGSSFVDTYGYTSTSGTYTGTISVSGDGIGLLLLPGMSHPNTLKVRSIYSTTLILSASTYTNYNIVDDFYNGSNKSALLSVYNSTMSSTTNTVTYISSGASINPSSYSGVMELTNNSKVNIYPNPATSILNIENVIGKIDFVVVLDITGRKVLERRENPSQINIESLEQGMYQLLITTEGKNYSRKFIKN
jgi:hypothetical protein